VASRLAISPSAARAAPSATRPRDRPILRRVGYLPEERGLYKKMTALDVIVLGNSNKGQPGALSVPLKQEAAVHVAQISGVPRRVSMPVRA